MKRVTGIGAAFTWTTPGSTVGSVSSNVVDRTDESEFGRFGWVIDPEGNKVELWPPPEGM